MGLGNTRKLTDNAQKYPQTLNQVVARLGNTRNLIDYDPKSPQALNQAATTTSKLSEWEDHHPIFEHRSFVNIPRMNAKNPKYDNM